MSWKKYFKPVNTVLPVQSSTSGSTGGYAKSGKFNSWLPEVYQGPPDRLQRYTQYEQMNMDHEVCAALDTVAEFCTQKSESTDTIFDFEFSGTPSNIESDILKNAIKQWSRINEFDRRGFKLVRQTLMYGDQFFIRDPETYKLYWVDPNNVKEVVVNESAGKKIETYMIKDLDLNHQSLVASTMQGGNGGAGYAGGSGAMPQGALANTASPAQGSASAYYNSSGGADTNISVPVEAENVIHVTMSDGLDGNWPFGTSELEPIFKIFKQKSMLEDAMLIYRIHRAPERRIFQIDVGDMPPTQANQYLERVKYEVQQKRLPNKTGGGSNISDSAYDPLCLSLDTRIPLLDGRVLPLSGLISEYEDGKENWVYSCDPETGKPVPGNITWAGITRKDADVIRLSLDNGESLTVTPDHKIPVLGKGFVEAKDLTEDDSLISFETRSKSLSQDADRSYTQIFDHEDNKWVFVHRMVANFFKEKGKHQEFTFSPDLLEENKDVVHHSNYDRYDNSPTNLQWMNHLDHILFHNYTNSTRWDEMSEDESLRIKDKIRNSLMEYWKNMPEDEYEKFCKESGVRSAAMHARKKNEDPDGYAEWFSKVAETRKKKFASDDPSYQRMRDISSENLKRNKTKNQEFIAHREIVGRIVDLIKEYDSNRLKTMELCNADDKFNELMRKHNPLDNKSSGTFSHKLTDKKLRKIYSEYGYSNWRDFKEKSKYYNHKVVGIEYLTEKMDTGTITIDGQERWHNYHTFAVESGIFVKNSTLEDYYFAVTADGRGSKVEVLPGGDNLGEINDMLYFNNKMFRALGIPSSYLPTGPDDGGASSSDGKVGTAFIQEFRFTERCKRHQRQIIQALDREFKLFLKHRGITIDNGMFSLKFSEPQNFSEYRQIELDSARIATFSQVIDMPMVAKQYALRRYMGWTELDIAENEKYWKMENDVNESGGTDDEAGTGLGQLGMGDADFEEESFDDIEGGEDLGGEDLGGDDIVDDMEI